MSEPDTDRAERSAIEYLRNRRALVTGASSGIGRAVALKLANSGAHVLGSGRDEEQLEETRRRSAPHARLDILSGDLSVAEVRRSIFKKLPNPDVAVLCAGILRHCPILDSDPQDWHDIIEINLLTTMVLAKELAGRMVAAGEGHIVLIGSTLAKAIRPTTAAYAASKCGLSAFAQGLRAEVEGKGIKITEVSPGFTESNVRRDVTNPEALRLISSAARSALAPEDVAEAVADVLSKPAHVVIDELTLRGVTASGGAERGAQ